jgi:hypothetical protein
MKRKWIVIVPVALLGMALVAFIGGQIVRLLWNWLLPPLFGVPEVSFWQAFGILALCRILFGGRGGHRLSHSRKTPEERERFRQRIRERFGFGPPTHMHPPSNQSRDL